MIKRRESFGVSASGNEVIQLQNATHGLHSNSLARASHMVPPKPQEPGKAILPRASNREELIRIMNRTNLQFEGGRAEKKNSIVMMNYCCSHHSLKF